MQPRADFFIDRPVVDVYETIYFSNTSANADFFRWDFGDGTISSSPNPNHSYELPGRYLVILEAYKGSQEVDEASMYIDVTSTSLEIEVLEYFDQYPVPEASIVLYTTQYDWDYMTNNVFGAEWFTDSKGMVTIHGLSPIVYYVDILHQSHNNWLLAEESMENVMTEPLEMNRTNSYVFYVDYLPGVSRKDGRKVEQFKIMKIERKSPGNQAK